MSVSATLTESLMKRNSKVTSGKSNLVSKRKLSNSFTATNSKTRQFKTNIQVDSQGYISLDISKRDLRKLPPELFLFIRLEHLNLSYNKLNNLSSDFSVFYRLKILRLDHNIFNIIPYPVIQCSHLIELDLSYNRIAVIISNVASLRHLRILKLNNNRIENLPSEIGDLCSLRELNLNFNALWNLPQSFHNLQKLQQLHLSSNKFEHIPPGVCTLLNLEGLSFKSNRLLTLPSSFENLKKLQNLSLAENNFESIPHAVCCLKSLHGLDMTRNKLRSLPSRINCLKHLKVLLISNNKLQALPNGLETLERLAAANNYLNSSQTNIHSMHRLTHLDLSNNSLASLPRGLFRCLKLKDLRLKQNKLTYLPQEITILTGLEVLDISQNRITVQPMIIDQLTSLKSFDLRGNPLEDGYNTQNRRRFSEVNNNKMPEADSDYNSAINFDSERESLSPIHNVPPTPSIRSTTAPRFQSRPRTPVHYAHDNALHIWKPIFQKSTPSSYTREWLVADELSRRSTDVNVGESVPDPSDVTLNTEDQLAKVVKSMENMLKEHESSTPPRTGIFRKSINKINTLRTLRGLSESPQHSDHSHNTPTDFRASLRYEIETTLEDSILGLMTLSPLESFWLTPSGGVFHSQTDSHVSLTVPHGAVDRPSMVSVQIETPNTKEFDKLKITKPSLSNIIWMSSVVHVATSGELEFNDRVTLTLQAPPSEINGRLHVISILPGRMCCIPYEGAIMDIKGRLNIQLWTAKANLAALVTLSKCKYKACKSLEALLHPYSL